MSRITCVVDNAALAGTNLHAEHGLSFWIDTPQGSVIFDTGQSGVVFARNLQSLNLDVNDADALVLSHAHYDHTGGLLVALSQNGALKIFGNGDLLRPRYAYREGRYHPIGLDSVQVARIRSAEHHLSDDPQQVLPGLWTTGAIFPRLEKEGRSAHHFVQGDDGWLPDPYRDDLSLVLETSEGLVVICGCCHAGLLNTLAHVKQTFDGPVIAVLGGTHLRTADDSELTHIVEQLERHDSGAYFYLNHCTGEHARKHLERAFGDRVQSFPAGVVLTI
jgi:7,8-dihydropterin-6-yl-methyl-4-(beta-D-ribofuranosyl)aminobenzene 5'-phosphate synthase